MRKQAVKHTGLVAVYHNTMSSTSLFRDFLLTLVILKCVFFFLGTVGNLVVFMFHVFVNRDKSPNNYFVANLALADFIVCLSIHPVWISNFVLVINGMEGVPQILCRLGFVSGAVSVALSNLALLAVTYDRYIFIVQPLHYLSKMSRKKTCTILACVWILSLAAILPSLLTEVTKRKKSTCEDAPWGEWILIAFADLPLIFIVFLNIKIFKVARTQIGRIDRVCSPQKSSRNVKKMKALNTFACIIGVLQCCYVPFSVMIFVKHFVCNTCVPAIVHSLILELVGINSIVNPYIYALRHTQHRKGYARILAAFFTCPFIFQKDS